MTATNRSHRWWAIWLKILKFGPRSMWYPSQRHLHIPTPLQVSDLLLRDRIILAFQQMAEVRICILCSIHQGWIVICPLISSRSTTLSFLDTTRRTISSWQEESSSNTLLTGDHHLLIFIILRANANYRPLL